MSGRHFPHPPCMECSVHPCICGGYNYPRSRRHHRAAERDWIDYMSDSRKEYVRRLRDKELPRLSRRPLRYFARVLLAFNLVVFVFCVYLVAR